MKLFKFLFVLTLGFTFLMTSCESDVIDEVITIEQNDPRVENNIINRTTSTAEGLDLECLSIDFPFQFMTINENQIDVNSEEDLEGAFTDSIDYIIDFIYPLNVTLADGTATAVNSIDELGELFAACIPDEGWTEEDFPAFLIDFENSCYELVFPLSLTDMEGITTTVADNAEFVDALATNEYLFFQFPLSLVDEDGGAVVAEDAQGLFGLLASCENVESPCDSIYYGSELACYDIQFPVSLELSNGSIFTAENVDEFTSAILAGNAVGFAFPMTLVNVEDGVEVIVNSEEELNLALSQCNDYFQPDEAFLTLLVGSYQCYDISFPVYLEIDGVSTEMTNTDILTQSGFNGGLLEFPVTVISKSDGITHVFENFDELDEFVEGC